MVASFVQRVTVAVSGVASNTGVLTTTAGNFLYVTAGDGSTAAVPATGVSDNRGDTFTLIQNVFPGASLTTYYAMNIAGGSTTFTCLMDQLKGTNAAYIIEEWTGIASTSALDQSATGTSASTTTPSSGTTAATTQGDEVVFVSAAIPGGTTTVTAGAGYSNLSSFLGAGTAGAFAACQSKVVSVTGTQTGGFTLGAARATPCVVNTFKAAGLPGPVTYPVRGGMTSAVARSSTW